MAALPPPPSRRMWTRVLVGAGVVGVLALVGSALATNDADPPTAAPTTAAPTTAAPTTAAPATGVPAPPPEGLDALAVLATVLVELEQPRGYERELFPHWRDLDGDGCDTRAEVLQRDSLTPAQVDPFGCGIVAGDWRSPYDGATWSDPGELDIDHVVPLKEAWDSGAWAWDEGRRTAFANDLDDPRSLRAVTAGANRSKGDRDPSNWMPPAQDDWCRYAGDWIAVKARWGLSMDQSEWGRLRNVLTDRCPGWRIDPWPAAPTR